MYTGVLLATALTGLFVLSLHHFLLFHVLVELFAIAVAWSVFLLVWASRKRLGGSLLTCLGVGLLYVGILDLFHTLAYKGMHVLQLADPSDVATQLWMAARFTEAFFFSVYALKLGGQCKAHQPLIAGAVLASGLLASILIWPVFPACFVEGEGLTRFKILGEYAVCLAYAGSMVVLARKRDQLNIAVFRLLQAVLVVNILSELAFTLYVDVYGVANALGHLLKVVSFLLIYTALVREGIDHPLDALFRDLLAKEQELEKALAEQQSHAKQISFQGTLLDHVRDPIITTDMDMNITYWNAASAKLYDFTTEEAVGKNVDQLLQSKFLSEPPEIAMKQFVETGFWRGEAEQTDKHGVRHIVELSCSWLRDGQGERIGIVGINRDITERKRLEQALVAASDREQKRLGQELHDGLCQDLKGLEIHLQYLADQWSDHPALKKEIMALRDSSNQALRRSYDISRGLLPIGLDEVNLADALCILTEQAKRESGLPVMAFIESGLNPGSEEIAQHLYRIAREALANAIIHARASHIQVRWFLNDSREPCLVVTDDGCGFDGEQKAFGGMGISIMRYRAQAIGATLAIRECAEQGTEVCCVCPQVNQAS